MNFPLTILAAQETSRAVSARTRSQARAEKLDDGDAITSPPRLAEPRAAASKVVAAAKPQKPKRGLSEPASTRDPKKRRTSKR